MEEIAKFFDGPDATVAHLAELTVQHRTKGLEEEGGDEGKAIEVSQVEVSPTRH